MQILFGLILITAIAVAEESFSKSQSAQTINFENTNFKKSEFLGHDFGSWTASRVAVYFIINLSTWVLSAAIPMGLEFFCKYIIKLHLEFHPVTGLANLLVVVFGFEPEEARAIIQKYHREHEPEEIAYYSQFKVSQEYIKLKKSKRLFYRTNFFELLYVFTRFGVVVLGTWIGMWVVQMDFVAWMQSSLINSVIILYGFMSFIQNIISQVFTLFSDDYRTGDLIFIRSYDVSGCILEFGSFRTKLGTVNVPLLKKILEEKSKNTPPPNQTRFVAQPRSNIGTDIQEHRVNESLSHHNTFHFSNTHGSSFLLPIPQPNNQFPAMREDNTPPTYTNGSFSGVSGNSPNVELGLNNRTLINNNVSSVDAYQSLLIYTYVPNMTFWQTNVSNLSC